MKTKYNQSEIKPYKLWNEKYLNFDQFIGKTLESYPLNDPSIKGETLVFTKEGDLYVTTGTNTGRLEWYLQNGELIYKEDATSKGNIN